MKKITKFLVCFMLCVCSLLMIACGDPRTKEEKNFTYPSSTDPVYGNGGLAVRKGNYLYFVNGYRSVSSLANKDDTVLVGSLMIMKLDANGNIVTNEEGLLKDDYYITMNDKLCGYQATNLYIHGDYLYFVSPCLENESGKNGPWAKERVEFNRVKLDKSSEVEKIYSSGVKFDSLEYQYYQENGNLNILAWEKGESYYEDYGKDALIRVDVASKSSKVVANNVQDVVFAKNGSQVFFVENVNNENYYLKKYNVGADSLVNYYSNTKNFDLVDVTGEEVFISIAHEYNLPEASTEIQSSNISTQSGFELRYSYTGTKEIKITSDGQIVLIEGNTFTFVVNGRPKQPITDSDASSINVIGYTNGCILYYDELSNIKLISYSNAIAGSEVAPETLTTISAVEEAYAYFDLNEEENRLYFFKKSGDDYYLHRIQVNNNFNSAEEMVGVYEDGDAPVVEEEEEEIEEE